MANGRHPIHRGIIETLCAVTPAAGPNHQGLLEAIRLRYPELEIHWVATRSSGPSPRFGIVNADRSRFATDGESYLRDQIDTTGSARQVWQDHLRRGLFRTQLQGQTLYLTVPVGPRPQDFVQIDVAWEETCITHELFRERGFRQGPENLKDLVHRFEGEPLDEPIRVGQPRYRLQRMTWVGDLLDRLAAQQAAEEKRRIDRLRDLKIDAIDEASGERVTRPFLDVFPKAMRVQPHRLERMLHDWVGSRAGGHTRFCDHWFLEVDESEGQRELDATPQGANGPELPSIGPPGQYASDAALLTALEDFDERAGYPFAWYFHMLRGHRVNARIGEWVSNALAAGDLHLAPQDARVLHRWAREPYGF